MHESKKDPVHVQMRPSTQCRLQMMAQKCALLPHVFANAWVGMENAISRHECSRLCNEMRIRRVLALKDAGD